MDEIDLVQLAVPFHQCRIEVPHTRVELCLEQWQLVRMGLLGRNSRYR